MKQNSTILTVMVFVFASITMMAQERYVEEIFTDVQVTSDVVYGVNGTIEYMPFSPGVVTEELLMDIYQPPLDDMETERPLVLVFHTGSFIRPLFNGQIAGSKTDNSAVEICTQLAKRGFVAASLDYRLGWNPLEPFQVDRDITLFRAIYRGIQDGNTAIRFFNQSYADGNVHGIDPNKITCWGNGTAGSLVLAMNGVDDYNEIVSGSSQFLLDLDMDGVPETAMVDTAYLGDVYGEVTTIAPDDAYGFPAGDTSNHANHVGWSNDFHLTVSIGGAIPDISWLSDQLIPIIAIQSPNDPYAPYDIGPLSNNVYSFIYGAGLQQIGAVQNAIGINQPWIDQIGIDAITQKAIENSAIAGHPYYEGAFPWVRPLNSGGFDEGVVINWWNPNDATPENGPGMGDPWNMVPHPTGGTFHDYGLILNEGMSAEKARANIAEVMDYVIPRACITLDLGCSILGTEETKLDEIMVSVAPNPAIGSVTVSVAGSGQMQKIDVYNIDGKLVQSVKDIYDVKKTVELNRQTPGMYVMKVYLEKGFVMKRLMVK